MATRPKLRSKSKSSTVRTRRQAPRAAAALDAGFSPQLGARTEYRIYPSIGIARIGDCKDSYIIGPEAPGTVVPGPYRGQDKGLKPQAARFRIYKVDIDDNQNETVTQEIVNDGNTEIVWSVNLANRKAAGLRIFDTLARNQNPGRRNDGLDRDKLVIAASGVATGTAMPERVLSGEIEFAKPRASGPKVSDIVLARLRTDEAGRLLVVGGPGTSESPLNTRITGFSDNDGWYDSVSDGPVSATLRIKGVPQPVVPAWVVVTVPRFAPGIYGVVTWYDQAVSMARTGTDNRFNSPTTTSFTRDIYPILRRADNLSAVHGVAHGNGTVHALSDAARLAGFADPQKRAAIQKKLTPLGTAAPDAQQRPPDTMPRLYSGADPDPDPAKATWTYLGLTRYQLAHIDNWVHGNFDADWTGLPPPVPFDQIPVAGQPWALCEAALEACVGGPFYPGIEGTYDIARAQTYHPDTNLRREFRINPAHPPGFLTEKMALPWQADFVDCTDYWWPSQRPDNVTTQDGEKVRWDRGVVGTTTDRHLNMVDFWSQLGVVVFDAGTGKFVEDERTLGTAVA